MLASILRQALAQLRAAAAADWLASIPELARSGRREFAERRLRRHLKRHPRDPKALHYLSVICHQSGRLEEAAVLIESALALQPDNGLLHWNLARTYRALGRLDAALERAGQAVRLFPENAEFVLELAGLLREAGRHADALAALERVLEREPGHTEALRHACRLLSPWRPREAIEYCERALKGGPGDAGTLVCLHRAAAWCCDWRRDTGELRAKLQAWADDPANPAYAEINPFVAHELGLPPALCSALARAHADRVIRSAGPRPAQFRFDDRRPGERIRIGYVSADFHAHPTMHLMRSVFALHDRRRFEVYAYSLGADDRSSYRAGVVADVDCFRDLRTDTAQACARRIFEDRIDILVDLKGFTHEARPGIFALRPAPVRAAWLGYPATTGQGLNDYAIVDTVVAPPEHAGYFGEKLVWLPQCYQVTDHRQPVADAAPARPAEGLPESGFVFACFSHVYKIRPALFDVWMRLLAGVPGSVLWLYAPDADARAALARQARERGVDPGRLVFAGTQDKPRHLARMRCADLFLDTLPINAHTGASDALWAGLPLLTCLGEAFPGRVAASVLAAAGLGRLVCRDLAEYEEKALRLARQPQELEALKRRLHGERQRLPLFQTPRFARKLEQAYQTMWRRFLDGLPPAAFAVAQRPPPDQPASPPDQPASPSTQRS